MPDDKKESKKETKEERNQKFAERRQLYVEMVKNDPTTRVTRVDAVDTHALLALAQIANRVMKRARDQGGRGIPIETFAKIVSDYDDMILTAAACLERMCDTVQLRYTKPRSVKEIEDARGRGKDKANTSGVALAG